MKKWKIALISLPILLTGTTAYSSNDINEAQALKTYTDSFLPETIDENFRSFYETYPSITIKKGSGQYELPISLRSDALPETYEFEGKIKKISELFDHTHTTGMMIMQGDNVIYEQYLRGNKASDHTIMMSVSKSMLSMLVGVAHEEGLIKLDDQVIKYVPRLKNTAYNGVTVRNVLEMSSGIKWSEKYADLNSELVRSVVAFLTGSLDEFPATLTRINEPGTYNSYASIETHVLGMILRGATGKSYEDYFHEKLWSKLGAESDVKMLVDATGQPVAYAGVNIRLRDMMRFGKLYLNQGRNYLGEQLVPAEWIRESTLPDSPRLMPMENNPASSSAFGYKYQWWIPFAPDGNDYSAVGIYGQYIYVNPKRKIVIVKTSAYPDYTKDGKMINHETLVAFQAIAKHLSPDAKPAN